MAWLAIRLDADTDTADAIADALVEAGALSVSYDDADAGTRDEAAQFAEPGMAPPRAWRRNRLTALVAADADPVSVVAEAARSCGIVPPLFETTIVEDQDWVRSTQLQFEPIQVAESLWIVPSWCTPPDPCATNISIDPGLAFGTGSHPTTRLVLGWLARTIKGGETVLDYGCGSGILAIAAARLGAREVAGVDIDPQAIRTAEDNAEKNRVRANFCTPDEFRAEPAEIVVANILANPLVVLSPLISAQCASCLALSGILESQADEVSAAYAGDFLMKVDSRDEGWVLLTGKRR